jgi:hypothetical protein
MFSLTRNAFLNCVHHDAQCCLRVEANQNVFGQTANEVSAVGDTLPGGCSVSWRVVAEWLPLTSRPGDRLSSLRLFVVFLSPSRQMLR